MTDSSYETYVSELTIGNRPGCAMTHECGLEASLPVEQSIAVLFLSRKAGVILILLFHNRGKICSYLHCKA